MAALLFRLHSVACLSSFGPTVLLRGFSALPTATRKCVCVCVCVLVSSFGPTVLFRGFLAFPDGDAKVFSCRPRGHAVRFRGRRSAIFLLFSVGPLHLVVFSLGWTRVLNLWRTGPRLPSRPPFPLMAGVGPVPAAAGAVPCCAGIAAGQRACACVRGADA